MALSYTEHIGDGITKAFTFSFVGQDEGYIRKDDVVVTVNDISVPFTFLSANTIEIASAPADGAVILIRRVMPKDRPYADFRRGNNFGQDTLNNSFLQSLYIIHEALDGFFPEGFKFLTNVKFSEGIDMEGKDISNVGKLDTGELLFDGKTLEEILPVLAAAASFSPISWHDQEVNAPVTIPSNKNAWSFGPELTINEEVVVGEGSYWTVAEGEKQGASDGDGSFSGNYDYGEL